MILIDNYDSFTYNVVQYLREIGIEPKIFKNDETTIDELKKLSFESIIISPGPKNPDNAGISMDVINEFHTSKKILGICLGHQCIAQYFGCKVIKSKNPTHGKVSKIYFEKDVLFDGIEQGFEATRYHSLIVDTKTLNGNIKPLAFTEPFDGGIEPQPLNASLFKFHFLPKTLMALRHKSYPIYGVQFHPEAILTQFGKELLYNFVFKV